MSSSSGAQAYGSEMGGHCGRGKKEVVTNGV